MSRCKIAPLCIFGHVNGVLRKKFKFAPTFEHAVVEAFDVVWHNYMLRKLYNLGLPPACWNILNDSYAEMSSVVNWDGELSKPFLERQCVRQGGIISPSAYKMFLNPLLNMYSANSLGLQIGSIFLGSPACADDLLFLAGTAIELQEMICVQEFYANDEHYDILNSKKTYSRKMVMLKLISGFKNRIRISTLTMIISLPISLVFNFFNGVHLN